MKDFKDNILQGITSGEIKAQSKWRFLAHDYFFWFLTGISTLLGALALSSILHRIAVEQVPLAPHLRNLETIPVFIQTLPFLWLVVLAVLGLAAWFNFKKTSKAYRHQLLALLGMMLISMLLGVGLFAAGVGSTVDSEIRNRVPAFEKQRIKRQEIRNNFLEKRGDRRFNQNQNNQQRPFPIAPPKRVR